MFTNRRLMHSATLLRFLLFTSTMLALPPTARAAERVPTDARAAHVTVSSEPATSPLADNAEVTVALREPDVLRAGKRNRIAVTLERAAGAPVSGADVRLTLYKPGISGPKGFLEYPVQTTVRLQEGARSGVYEGIGVVPAPGMWQVTVAVKLHGDQIAGTTTKRWARW